MFKIEANSAMKRVEVTNVGVQDGDMDDFMTQFKNAARAIKMQHGHFDILADQAEAHPMQQDRANVAEELMEWCQANGLRKSANIVGTVVYKMQIKRVSHNHEAIGIFETREAAEAWLAEE